MHLKTTLVKFLIAEKNECYWYSSPKSCLYDETANESTVSKWRIRILCIRAGKTNIENEPYSGQPVCRH